MIRNIREIEFTGLEMKWMLKPVYSKSNYRKSIIVNTVKCDPSLVINKSLSYDGSEALTKIFLMNTKHQGVDEYFTF